MSADRHTELGTLFEPAFHPRWERRSLWDTATWVNGLAFRNIAFAPTGDPVIKIAELKNGISSNTRYTREQLDAKYRVERGDVLYSWSGSPETSLDVFVWSGRPGWLNQHIFKITTRDGVDRNFHIQLLRYLRPNLVAIATNKQTTGLGHVTKQDLQRIIVGVPGLPEQEAITRVLGSLDDKIELNRRMNETLEAMARALFKSWFVDFDPVRAKQEGRAPYGMDAETAALFPDAFEDSELGPIPKGWRVAPVYDIASYVNGAAYKAFQPNEDRIGLPIIKIAELKAGVTETTKFSAVEMPRKYLLARGDILFSWSGNPDTSIDTFVWSHGPAWLNQHIFRVEPHRLQERSFVLATLKYLRPVFAEIARDKQTTGLGHVTAGDLKRLQVVVPPDEVLRAWNAHADPLFARGLALSLESQTLAELRDTLLPKLISGELRLPEASDLAESALAEAAQ